MYAASPTKRTKVSAQLAPAPAIATDGAAAAAAAVTGEPALLQNIVSFIPLSSSDKNDAAHTTTQPALVLQTMAALCRAITGLSRLVGPTNEAFWRDMVLTHFNFATDAARFNVEDWGGCFYNDDDRVDDTCDDPEYAHWHRHPKNGPHREWIRDYATDNGSTVDPSADDNSDDSDVDGDSDDGRCTYPELFLVNSLAHWSVLRVHFKSATYGFLEKVQQDRSQLEALWPGHEDAFSLFCDLLLLPRFESNDDVEWGTWSDGEQPVYPCLLGRFPTTIVGRGFAMLKFCDFAPYFWDGPDKPVSNRWSGLDGPLPPIKCAWETLRAEKKAEREATVTRRQEHGDGQSSDGVDESDDDEDIRDADHEDCEERTDEEHTIFPLSQDLHTHPFQHLRRFVYETFSDWRGVHLNQGENGSPMFYIGSTKRSGRWMGFVGQSDYET